MGVLNPAHPLDVVGKLATPLLLVHGDRDTTVPVRNARLLAERTPQAALRIYHGVGHGVAAMRMQVPQRLLADLRTYFSAM
jgi:fermentation-respiration switch protein FrsA (DUF1100 family)